MVTSGAGGGAYQTGLDVHIVTPDREVWAGEARFVIARAGNGDVGVLPGHEPMLSVLRPGDYRVETVSGEVLTGNIDSGFLSVGRTPAGQTRVDLLAEHVNSSDEATA